MMSETIQAISRAVIEREKDVIEDLVKKALDEGLSPDVIINQGLVGAMDVVGKQFSDKTIFVPEMLVSAFIMKKGLDLVKPLLVGDQSQSQGVVLMATVKGDLHDIGKNIVCMMLEGAGFKVIDLGVDISVDQLLDQVAGHQPQVLGLSALLTTTMPEMQKVIEGLEEKGIRNEVKVIVGGAPVDQGFADKIGADGYADDAAQAVTLARSLM
jgi:5-methyltetrahydrofolate--homocysteine methyltransferase